MGKEIRRVPPNWEHPKYPADHEKVQEGRRTTDDYMPMFDTPFKEAAKEWIEGLNEWDKGERQRVKEQYGNDYEYWEWSGEPPDRDYYRPEFTEEPTWFQVYQTVSEGTPVTPPFATEEELIDYLVENGDFWCQKDAREGKRDSFRQKPSRESATAFVKGGWAPSMIVTNDENGVQIKEGINALT